jgi:oxaloacetate decarboxylase gamma subunit
MLGMGIVFGFLIILIIAVTLVGKIIRALGLDKNTGALPKPAASTGPSAAAKSAAVTAAITAAVTEYRKNEGK